MNGEFDQNEAGQETDVPVNIPDEATGGNSSEQPENNQPENSQQPENNQQEYSQQPENNQQAYSQQPVYNQQAYSQQPEYNQQANSQQPEYNQAEYNQQAYNQQEYSQQSAYNQQPYMQPQYQNPVKPKGDKTGFGIASLVLGVVSVFLFGCCVNYILAVLAIVFGIIQMVRNKPRAMAIAGIVTACVSIILGTVMWIGVYEHLDELEEFYMDPYDYDYDEEDFYNDYLQEYLNEF